VARLSSGLQAKAIKDRANEDDALAFYNRGRANHEIRNYDRAIQDYTRTIELDPKYSVAFNSRGNAYHAQKDYGRAIHDHDQAIRLNPSYASAFNSLGIAYHAKREYERVIQNYGRAIELHPNYAAAFNNRGNVYRSMRDYERAIQDYDQAIHLNPNYALAMNNRAVAYRGKKDYERALADHEAAARIDPKVARHKLMGYTLFNLGRMAQSAEAMERAVKAAPQDMYAILWRYITVAKENKMEIASRELGEHAAKLNETRWPVPVVHFFLGKINEKEMYAAAENPDPKKTSEQICEANFYAAEAKLLKSMTNEAIPLLRAAEKECPPTFYESHGARAELKRLGY
jgi:lipoprotein NlpI